MIVHEDVLMLCLCMFFFFKQKTAYEMRISDWSSDVCSSDLHRGPALPVLHQGGPDRVGAAGRAVGGREHGPGGAGGVRGFRRSLAPVHAGHRAGARLLHERSEEHTSELQSLMRISYAVFCLKKKKK